MHKIIYRDKLFPTEKGILLSSETKGASSMKKAKLIIWTVVLTLRHRMTRHIADLIRLERAKEKLAATR